MNPSETYRTGIRKLGEEIRRLRKKDLVLICAKLVLFAAGVAALYQVAVSPADLALTFFGILSVLFILAAVLHGQVLSRKRFREILSSIHQAELDSLEGRFLDTDDGHDFTDQDHPFSSDLDLFGPRSLFHLLNRTVTGIGKARLADWLRTSTSPDGAEISRRQASVRELAPFLDFRHRIRAHRAVGDKALGQSPSLPSLIEEPYLLIGRKILSILIRVLPVLTLLAVVTLFYGYPRLLLYSLLAADIALVLSWEKRCARIFKFTEKADDMLRTYAKILEEIETAPFAAERLRDLQAPLSANGVPASRWIRRLSSILGSFELRRSIFHMLLNPLLLWDLRCVLRIEKWRKATGQKVEGWFRAVAEIEALSSFANLDFNNPDWAYPEIVTGPFCFEARSLGMPLIPRAERVTSDFRTQSGGSISIVTGPNMAGKSTFLKTVGVNMVLAFAGAPACASRLSVSAARLVTSMKVSDSLDKGMSLFYAELRRLKMILEPVEQGEQVFFLIDEMLKGTNALDRQKGSIALLRQLAEREISGLVATHDLQLTELEKAFPSRVENYHFDGFVEDDRLFFDYKLKKGRCESFNALVLMRKMGIEV